MSKKHHNRGAGNDPNFLFYFYFLFFEGGGGGCNNLSPPRLNIFTVGNMEVMICLDQGGLRSLSASSFNSFHEQSFLCLADLRTVLYNFVTISFTHNS